MNDLRPSLLVAAAVLLCYTALWLAAGPQPALALFAALLIASYFTRIRIGSGIFRLALRLAVLGVLLAASRSAIAPGAEALIGDTGARNLLGQAAAAEALMQFWRHRPADPRRGPLSALFFGGLTLLTACNSYANVVIRVLAPLFLLLTLLALRAYRPHPGGLRPGLFWRIAALTAPLALGAFVSHFLYERRSEIMNLGFRMLGDRFSLENAGMSENPRLGPLFDLRGSPARTLRVVGYDGGHLRGNAFSSYRGGGWHPGVGDRSYVILGSTSMKQPDYDQPVATAQVTRFLQGSPLVFAPLAATAIDLNDGENLDWAPAHGGPIRATASPPYLYTFAYPTETPARETHQGVAADPPSLALKGRLLEMPATLRNAIAPLAKKATAGARMPQEKIAAVVAYLQENHSYSLRFQPGRGDPVADFLARPGAAAHCEFFASASALLLRAVGIPTRYVVGYFAHEAAGDNTVVVRQRDAHAWTEAWIDGVGWMTVEATPGDGLPDADPTGPEPWRRVFEWLQDFWQALTRRLGDLDLERTPLLLAGALGVGIMGFLATRVWRGKRATVAERFGAPPPHLAPLATRFETALQRQGIVVPPHLPWAERLAQQPASPLRERAERFAHLYDAARFGGGSDPAALRTALEAVEQAPPLRTPLETG